MIINGILIILFSIFLAYIFKIYQEITGIETTNDILKLYLKGIRIPKKDFMRIKNNESRIRFMQKNPEDIPKTYFNYSIYKKLETPYPRLEIFIREILELIEQESPNIKELEEFLRKINDKEKSQQIAEILYKFNAKYLERYVRTTKKYIWIQK